MTARDRRTRLPPIGANNCPIIERTGDGRSAGRCWHFCKGDVCPRHGDVSWALARYRATGDLTDEKNWPNASP